MTPELHPPHAGAGDSEPALAADLQAALYAGLPVSQLAAMLVAVGLAVFFDDGVDPLLLRGWLAYMVLVALFRGWTGWRFGVAAQPRDLDCWDRLFFSGVLLAGAGWGAAGVAFFDPTDIQQQVLLTGAIAGVSAGSVAHLNPSLRAVAAFLLLSLTPLIYAYLTDPAAGPGLGALIGLYLLTMLLVARRSHHALRSNMLLLHGNQRLVAQLTERTDALEAAKAQDEAEREMALSVFSAIVPHSALAADNLIYHLSSQSAFNGDLLLVETRPDGRQNLMLGDFTGHGLAASLGAIPAADIFVTMTRKGFPLNVIVAEINRKLYTHLPRNLFCAACLAEVDAGGSRVHIWNGGIPSVYLLGAESGTIQRHVAANHLPLGILAPGDFDNTVQTLPIAAGDQVFMATDGVIEQRNAAGEMFGEQRLERILDGILDVSDLARALKAELARFGKGVDQGDDITFVALRAEYEQMALRTDADAPVEDETAPLDEPDWSMSLVLQPEALRRVDPVPLISHLVREFNGAGDESVPFEMVLGELYKNALEHGVLGLESTQKQSTDGFDDYYRRRETQLAGLQSGRVTLELSNHPAAEGGVLELLVSDTGQGFDHRALAATAASESQAHGRGVRLVRSFCRSLEFLGPGNRVRALFRWRPPR